MTRKSKAQQERSARLRALMHEVPQGTDIGDLIFEFVPTFINAMGAPMFAPPGADRHAAIACCAAIEHGLRAAITLHLAPDADLKDVFERYPAAPLSGFADRIAMARALGIINDAQSVDFATIKEIRNTFAHSILPINFRNEDIAHLVSNIRKLDEPLWAREGVDYIDPRARYVLSCAIHYMTLKGYTYRRPTSDAERIALADALLNPPQGSPQLSILDYLPGNPLAETP